jgi:hypothetical protein
MTLRKKNIPPEGQYQISETDKPYVAASLSPVAYKIKQNQNPHTYWIQRLNLGQEGPRWFILLRLSDPSAYLDDLKQGYMTPESALSAWQKYADRRWPRA